MKKKSLMVLITCTIIIAMFGLFAPVSADRPSDVRALFEMDIVPLLDSEGYEYPLDKGEVWIREFNGDYLCKVEIEGAAEGTYFVYLMFGSPSAPTEIELSEPLITDEEGEGKLVDEIALCSDTGDASNPWIEIRLDGAVHYVSGFKLGSCAAPGPSSGPMEY